jgi:hypothetical protein
LITRSVLGGDLDVAERDVGDGAVGQADDLAGVGGILDGDVVDEDVANGGDLGRIALEVGAVVVDVVELSTMALATFFIWMSV